MATARATAKEGKTKTGDLEARIAREEERITLLEAASAKALAGGDYALAGRQAEEAAKVKRLVDKLYAQWMDQA